MSEEPYRRMDELVGAMADAVSFQPPFALFGHSLGAVVAFELARTLRDRGGPEPRALILSSYQAPHLPRTDPDVHGLPDEQLLPIVERQYGEVSTALRDDPEFLRFTLGYHRADFEMIETYRYVEGRPLSVPLIVTGGTEDYPVEALEAWRRHTTGPFSVRRFPGDHFYLRGQREELLRLIASTLMGDDPSASSRRVA
jgi:surfactin synthase thioesterase subunit